VGNIYKGEVCRVLPGMQAAFVDIGLPRLRLFISRICARRTWKKKVRKSLNITCMKVSLLSCKWSKIRWVVRRPFNHGNIYSIPLSGVYAILEQFGVSQRIECEAERVR